MAEEVGAAYVSLIPSARGFSRKAKEEITRAMRGVKDDEVTIPVKPEIDPVTGALRAELEGQIRALAKRIALQLPVGADTTGLRARLEAQLAAARAGLSMQIPTEPGDMDGYRRRLRDLVDSTRSTQHIKVDVDKDVDDRTRTRLTQAGGTAGRLFTSGFGSTLLNPLIGIPALILAAIAGPAVAAVTAGATLAGGGLAGILLGGFALRADKELRAAVAGLGTQLNEMLTKAAAPLKGPFLQAISIISKALKGLGPELKGFFTTIAPSIPKLAQGFGGFLKSFQETGAIEKFAKAIGPALDQLAMALPDIGNAFAQFLISIAQVGPEGAHAFGVALRTTADIIRFTGDAIVWLTERLADISAAIDWVKERVKDLYAGFLTILLALGGFGPAIDNLKEGIRELGHDIAEIWRSLWDSVTAKVSSAVDSSVGFLRAMPGKIVAAVGDVSGLLFNAGRNVVNGLIEGIKSKLGDLAGIASKMAGTIRNYLPFSPAKEGPLSGSGNPFASGQAIATNLAAGVDSQLPTVATAADELAGLFGPGSLGTGGMSMAAVRPVVEVNGSGLPDALNEWLRHNVRVLGQGGTVESAYAAM